MEYDYTRIFLSLIHTRNARLAQKGEHRTKKTEVPSSILIGGSILLLEFMLSVSKVSDANTANLIVNKSKLCKAIDDIKIVCGLEAFTIATISHVYLQSVLSMTIIEIELSIKLSV